LVGLRYCTTRAVNEPRLDPAPGLDEACTISWGERSDVQARHSFCALFEAGLCMLPAPVFLHSAVIFSATKLRAQFFSSALSEKKPHCYPGHRNHHKSNE